MNHDSQAFKVCEKFVSINGEGIKAGQLSVFVRLRAAILTVRIVILSGQMKKTRILSLCLQTR